jgi:RNA-directed DNA polymerase
MRILDTLSDTMLTSKSELLNFTNTAPRRYKIYYIPKRNSNERRLIAQPAKTVKFIQALVTEELRNYLSIHCCATAYEKGTGIKKNAWQHKSNQYLLKMDFKNFFLSITPELFFLVARDSGFEFIEEDKELLSNLLFWKLRRSSPLRLSIGAPSSPFISNFIMYNFDAHVDSACKKLGVTYTRYADDLTFTTNKKGVLSEIPTIVKSHLKTHCHSKIRINTSKTVYSSKAFNRHITGVTITNDGKLSVGREKKRVISSMLHRYSLGMLNDKQVEHLKGQLSHIKNIEPDFENRMQNKYGADLINKLWNRTSNP